jgi:hypothetical protein
MPIKDELKFPPVSIAKLHMTRLAEYTSFFPKGSWCLICHEAITKRRVCALADMKTSITK